ncbi:AAA family ATPase [bacterium]|nr:AAA family ATPase [bacterium]
MYKEFFNFDIMPFNTTPDSSFFFASEQHQEALARLKYAIDQRKGFVLITGEIGSGKTTVCHTLLSQLPGDVKTALITNTRLTGKELLKEICTEFEISTKRLTRLELLHQLNDFLIHQLANENNAVIIIDEAQNLSPRILEELRLISNLETDKEKLVQIILMGQPELSDKLELNELKQLKQRIVTRFHIYPMNFHESEEYIYHRLKIAGARKNKIFSDDAIHEIIKYSKGIPRLINIIADQALLQAYSCGKSYINNHLLTDVIKEFGPPERKNIVDDPNINYNKENTEQQKKTTKAHCIKNNGTKKGFWSKLFSKNNVNNFEQSDNNDDDEGIVIEFDGINFQKIHHFNKRFSRYLIGKAKKNKLVIKENCFDKFRSELKKEGIYIESLD